MEPGFTPGHATLLTIHKSKGKEFPHVVYFNLSRRAGAERTEADERRVAYVGVTRAKNSLLITADQARPSPFLKEFALNPEFNDFAEPYLERLLAIERRRIAWKKRDVQASLQTFTGTSLKGTHQVHGYTHGEIDLLETELRFRAALGIRLEP